LEDCNKVTYDHMLLVNKHLESVNFWNGLKELVQT